MTKLDVLGVIKHRAVLYLEHTHHAILLGSVLTGLTGGLNVKHCSFLKGLCHAILGNFSTDQIVIIKITAQNLFYRRTQTKHRKAKQGHGWTKPERIKMDCIWVNLKNVGPPFFLCQFIHVSK